MAAARETTGRKGTLRAKDYTKKSWKWWTERLKAAIHSRYAETVTERITHSIIVMLGLHAYALNSRRNRIGLRLVHARTTKRQVSEKAHSNILGIPKRTRRRRRCAALQLHVDSQTSHQSCRLGGRTRQRCSCTNLRGQAARPNAHMGPDESAGKPKEYIPLITLMYW